ELEVRVVKDTDAPPPPKEEKRRRLAVVTPTGTVWDDMGKLLGELGEGYKYAALDEQNLKADPGLLDRSRFDVVFLTCSNGGQESKDQLRRFVDEGGILYASDLRYGVLSLAFPEFVDKGLRAKAAGAKQVVQAEVQEPDLRAALGKTTIELQFDLDGWVTAAF